MKAEPGTLLSLACDLDQGFIDAGQNVVVIAATDRAGRVASSSAVLAEAELRIGDVVVHEDHGVGVLKDLESITVDDVTRTLLAWNIAMAALSSYRWKNLESYGVMAPSQKQSRSIAFTPMPGRRNATRFTRTFNPPRAIL